VADAPDEDGGEGSEEMEKLTVEELWNMLSEGAAKVFSPTEDGKQDYAAADYDQLIEDAEPAKWDDRTGGDAKGDAAPSAKEADLEGTIFSKKKRGRPKKADVVDLVSSDDESFSGWPKANMSSSKEENVENNMGEMQRNSHFATTVLTNKRTRKAPKKFEANFFETGPQKKKNKAIVHDANCFCCRKPVKKIQPPPKLLARSCNAQKKAPVDPDAPLECIVCPRVYHLECSEERRRPKTKLWYCPWRACVTCKRKSSQAGGSLFHCMSCPLTYCFDCAPDEHTEGGQSTSAAARRLTKTLEQKHMKSLKSYLFFECGDCKTRSRRLSSSSPDCEDEEYSTKVSSNEKESDEEKESIDEGDSSEEKYSSEEDDISKEEYGSEEGLI